MRGFSDEERNEIREGLVEAGRELFVKWGPEKTNVADVTDEVGIAKSTFYRFFDSKSELYFEVFMRERDDFLDALLTELEDVDDAETGLRTFFEVYFSWMERSPPIQRIVLENDHEAIYRDVSDERIAEEMEVALETFAPLLEEWQRDGEMRAVDPHLFFGLMKSVGLLALYEEDFSEFEEGWYVEIRELLLDVVAKGLTA
jgi:AcrR family transcriptional regulator